MNYSEVIEAIEKELKVAITKYPGWTSDIIHASTIVTEKSGELAEASLQSVYEPWKVKEEEIKMEAIQTAVTAIRFLLAFPHNYHSSLAIQIDQQDVLQELRNDKSKFRNPPFPFHKPIE